MLWSVVVCANEGDFDDSEPSDGEDDAQLAEDEVSAGGEGEEQPGAHTSAAVRCHAQSGSSSPPAPVAPAANGVIRVRRCLAMPCTVLCTAQLTDWLRREASEAQQV
jgi:hypothetical protein